VRGTVCFDETNPAGSKGWTGAPCNYTLSRGEGRSIASAVPSALAMFCDVRCLLIEDQAVSSGHGFGNAIRAISRGYQGIAIDNLDSASR
jgi:hypothetical protein